MRFCLALMIVATFAAGCGSSSSPATATPIALLSYTDPNFSFSFRYPADWRVPRGGGKEKGTGHSRVYELPVSTSTNQAGIQITLQRSFFNYTGIVEGHIGKDPNAPVTYHYHHLRVSGWPAIQAERFRATAMDAIDTITNVRGRAYDVQIVAGTSTLSSSDLAGYQAIVKSLRLPF